MVTWANHNPFKGGLLRIG